MSQIRALLLLIALFLTAVSAYAQGAPQVTATLSATNTPVGQPLTLTVEVLVPTWMPSPPVFPDFEQPDLLVRQPQRAGSPISRKIDGETWSGVSRRYLLIPLKSGRFDLPSATLDLTWADPKTRAPLAHQVALAPLMFEATVPAGAADLRPILLAQDIQLEQVIEGGPALQVGDPIIRTVTARINGTTPILMPLLLTDISNQTTLRAYPGETKTREDIQRGKLSGVRVETVTYLAQQSGVITLPSIELHWFDLDEETLKTAHLKGASFDIAAPPPPPPDATAIALGITAALLVLALCYWGARRLTPWITNRYLKIRSRWHLSPHYTRRQVITALRSRDLTASYRALDVWNRAVVGEVRHHELSDLLLPLGKDHYSDKRRDGTTNHWKDAERQFTEHSQAVLRHRNAAQKKSLMDHLNP